MKVRFFLSTGFYIDKEAEAEEAFDIVNAFKSPSVETLEIRDAQSTVVIQKSHVVAVEIQKPKMLSKKHLN